MTKKKKIELLVKDNKRLMEENNRLHELDSEELGNRMVSEIGKYSDIINKLYGKYGELDRLKITGIKNRWKYRLMRMGLKARKIIGV